MSTAPAVTMAELELESAELLPSRETLNVVSHYTNIGLAQVGLGNTAAQSGLINVAALNGNNILSLGSGNIL